MVLECHAEMCLNHLHVEGQMSTEERHKVGIIMMKRNIYLLLSLRLYMTILKVAVVWSWDAIIIFMWRDE